MSFRVSIRDRLWARFSFCSCFFKSILIVFVFTPFFIVRVLAFLVNKWHQLILPLNSLTYEALDALDKHIPNWNMIICWCANSVSLALHFIDYILKIYVLKILIEHQRPYLSLTFLVLILANHYLMACTMFMELDFDPMGDQLYAKDLGNFIGRLWDVLFWDTQLLASVIHSNRMLDGLTQMLLKGYEESRVALQALTLSIPTSIVLFIMYKDALQWSLPDQVEWKFRRQEEKQVIMAAVVVSVLNSIEKFIRMSLCNPQTQGERTGFPLMYISSNAATPPQPVIRDWLLRCQKMLYQNQDKLILRDLFSYYTFQVRSDFLELCDAHKAMLVRKAVRAFNYKTKKRLIHLPLLHEDAIRALDADGIRPGKHLSRLLGDILLEASGFHTLILSNNDLDDAAVSDYLTALGSNEGMKIQFLDLSGNRITEEGAEVLAEMLTNNTSIYWLDISNNPVRDAGVSVLAEALKINCIVDHLNLQSCEIGTEGVQALAKTLKINSHVGHLNLRNSKPGVPGCDALGKMLKSNNGIRELNLSSTDIEDQALIALCQGLTANKQLEVLNISSTNISEYGCQAILDVLKTNTSLREVNVMDCPRLDASWNKVLAAAVRGHRKPR